MPKKKNSKVGYKKPPKNTQFKKGRSGNPKGRPRGKAGLECMEDMRAAFMKAAQMMVTITIDGRQITMTALEAVYYKLHAKCMAGDLPSIRLAHAIAREAMSEHVEMRAEFFGHLQWLQEEFDSQPEDDKDPQTIFLLDLTRRRVNAKITDKL